MGARPDNKRARGRKELAAIEVLRKPRSSDPVSQLQFRGVAARQAVSLEMIRPHEIKGI